MGWYSIGKAEENGWVSEPSIGSASVVYRYMTSMHWSIALFHGAMEINPGNMNERLFTIVFQFLAFIISASFVSSVTNVMIAMQELRHQSTMLQRALRTYLKRYHIATELSIRLKKFLAD